MRGRINAGGEVLGLSGSDRIRKRGKHGMVRTSPLLIGLLLTIALGFTVYFRLWVIDYKISSDDAEIIRRQFDIAHNEAVDESAEWRLRFDKEREKAYKCMSELDKKVGLGRTLIKGSGGKRSENLDVNKRLELLQKENIDLLERLEVLKRELETEKLKCSTQ